MLRVFAMLLAISLLLVIPVWGEVHEKPVILIYSPNSPGYGHELECLIEEDGRMDAEISVIGSSELFNLMLSYPDVKVAVVAIGSSVNQNVGLALERFFSEGGGLVGLGFAGSREATGRCSERVFPIFGTTYFNGKFDPGCRCFQITHVKVEEDEISQGVGDFTAQDSKVVLSTDVTRREYLPREPEGGEYKVLFRDAETSAPTVVKYENKGYSVAFASFVGEDQEGGMGYFGRFTRTPAFRTLFANAVYWAWSEEKRHEQAVSRAAGYQERRGEAERLRQEGEERERHARQAWLARSVVVSLVAAIALGAVFWATFLRAPKE